MSTTHTPERLLRDLARAADAYARALAACRDHGPGLFALARRRLGLTQRALAEALGCHHTYLSKIEQGHFEAGLPVLRKLHGLLRAAREESSAKPEKPSHCS